MVKTKSFWVCKECGQKETKWVGSCRACREWNTFVEEVELEEEKPRFEAKEQNQSQPFRLKDVVASESQRYLTHLKEFDRVLGGGVVVGSLTLLGGDPGIGKSSLMLQISEAYAKSGLTVLYVCGEESKEQTSLRAKRLGVASENLFLLSETNFSLIKSAVDQLKPQILIVDSIQIVYKPGIVSAPGSVVQVREIAMEFMHLSKGCGVSTFLIGHVTKTGEIAGPKTLEHLVDTVLEFEGDKQHGYRCLRTTKNRFGPTDEIALFQMQTQGLVEVHNPSFLFLQERLQNSPGSVIVPTVEGSRAILVEVQSLVAPSAFSNSSRRSTGLDPNRLALLLALLEKRMGYQLHHSDVFVSVTGGLKIMEPAVDLAVLLAVASSFRNKMVDPNTVILGEVGLGGEVRSVSRVESRIKEAVHMGFARAIIPKRNLKSISTELFQKITIIGIDLVEDAISEVT
jgi:DNA repair protein RadA/Sms